jgi:hypothetical protein
MGVEVEAQTLTKHRGDVPLQTFLTISGQRYRVISSRLVVAQASGSYGEFRYEQVIVELA